LNMCIYQVVSGINYRLVVRLGELDCKRNEDKDPSACQVNRVSLFYQHYNNNKSSPKSFGKSASLCFVAVQCPLQTSQLFSHVYTISIPHNFLGTLVSGWRWNADCRPACRLAEG